MNSSDFAMTRLKRKLPNDWLTKSWTPNKWRQIQTYKKQCINLSHFTKCHVNLTIFRVEYLKLIRLRYFLCESYLQWWNEWECILVKPSDFGFMYMDCTCILKSFVKCISQSCQAQIHVCFAFLRSSRAKCKQVKNTFWTEGFPTSAKCAFRVKPIQTD